MSEKNSTRKFVFFPELGKVEMDPLWRYGFISLVVLKILPLKSKVGYFQQLKSLEKRWIKLPVLDEPHWRKSKDLEEGGLPTKVIQF